MKKTALFVTLIALNLILGAACTKVETEPSPTVGHTTTTQTEAHSIRSY